MLRSTINPLLHTNRFETDAMGRVIRATTALGNTRAYTYDPAGRVSEIVAADGLRTRQVHSNGLLSRIVMGEDASKREKLRRELELGRFPPGVKPAAANQPSMGLSGLTNVFRYGSLGLESEFHDPSGAVWRLERDALGRRTATVDPLNRRTQQNFDERGRPVRVEFPQGLGHLQASYDGFNAITRRAYSDGTDLHYQYNFKGELM